MYLSYDTKGLGQLQHKPGGGAAVGLPTFDRVADVVVKVGFQLQLASTQLGEVRIRFKAPQWPGRTDRSSALYSMNTISVMP